MNVSTLLRLVLGILCILGFGYAAMYSNKLINKVLASRNIIAELYYKLFGAVLRNAHLKVSRTANLNKKSKLYKIYVFFDDIIVNLDMAKDNVTVTGLLLFIGSISLSCGVVLSFLMLSWSLILPITCAFFYLIMTLFRMAALLKYEKREAEIMDAVDLLVSDVGGGIYNAILRYRDSFHPNIKHHFVSFIDDIQNKGYSFKEAMVGLNDKLGANFTDFAQKAILYEDKADSTMDDIFSAIIETNRQRRTLRYINNIQFAALRTQFIVSLVLIMGYGGFTAMVEPFILQFLFTSTVGRIMLIFDVALVAWVISYLAAIKAKSL